MMVKRKGLILILFFSTFLYSENNPLPKKLYYDDIDTKNQEISQNKINITYSFGIEILQQTIKNIQKNSNLDKNSLFEECNESLYLAIFDKTIVDKLGRDKSFKRFMNDCKLIIKRM